MIDRPAALTGAVERELGWAASVAHASLLVGTLAGIDEAHQREALDRFEQLAVPAAVIGRDKLHRANDAWRQLFRTSDAAWAAPHLDTVLSTGEALHVPELFVRAGSRRIWMSATVIRAPAEDAAIVVCAELTDAVIACELQVAEERLIWSGNVRTPEVADYSNARMRTAIGGDFGHAWTSIVHGGDFGTWTLGLAEAAQHGVSRPFELRLQCADGEYRWHRVAVVVRDGRWFSIAVDRHDLYTLESERTEVLDRLRAARVDAEQAHRLKDQVLAAVSHELRAPVTTIMLWERVLRDPTADPSARAQALDAIHQSAIVQSRIVADLLDMSRAISGKLFVDFRNVELGVVVTASVEAAIPAARAKKISLTYDGSTSATILGDASRLRQVIDNLLSNAIKFTEPSGWITVTLQRKGRVVSLEVEDNGRGIAPHLLNRIFEPFSQGETAISGREGGLGLGLSIARQIAELHHGTLAASSEGPGRGARLTLVLPTAGQSRAPSPPVGVVTNASLKSVRVLVVDDDERVRNALALLLDRAGAIVDRAESAVVARQQIARRDPQIILCDIAMPDEDGYQFIRKLRASGIKIPAIALTAYASQADAEQALSAGFDLHVAKPVDFQRLVASLTQVMQHRSRDSV